MVLGRVDRCRKDTARARALRHACGGISLNWYWTVGWEYLTNLSAGLQFGEAFEIGVWLAMGVIAGALTFVQAYKEIVSQGGETWMPYLVAFNNGFFREAALDAVMRHFVG